MRLRHNFLPSIFTVLNMFSGLMAVLQIIQGHYITAVLLIILAMVFDSLDGFVARLTHQASDFGIEFDSLADLISFCLVPSLLLHELYVADQGLWGGIISFMPLLFGAVRLARFNLTATTDKKSYFIGMPVPANALTISSYVWFNYRLFGNYGDAKLILPLSVVLAFLMVSRIRFAARLKISFRHDFLTSLRSALAILVFLTSIIFNAYVIFPIMLILISMHIIQWLIGYEQPRIRLARRRIR